MVQAFDGYEFERQDVEAARESDFALVNLYRDPVGAPMPPDAINDLVEALCHRAGLTRMLTPHQMRHAFASNVADAGGSLDEVQELMGHASMVSSIPYLHPDPSRLRAAVDRVPTPRERTGAES